jgi:hypothetical protein
MTAQVRLSLKENSDPNVDALTIMLPNLFQFQAMVSIKNREVSIYGTSCNIFRPK